MPKIGEGYEALRALIDDTIKGVMRSLGDAGANPTNTTGYTALYHLREIYLYVFNTSLLLGQWLPPETFTTTPLGANAVYTGPAKDFGSARLGFMGCLAFADQASATNGFAIEESIDGSNWDLVMASTTVSANVGAYLKVAVVARYARVKYTNGATAQTVFRLGGRYMIA